MDFIASLPQGVELRHFAEIDSTNEEARRLADAGVAGPVWIVADRQTAGRGRRGREWQSPTGNFSGTLFLRPRCSLKKAAELSFVAGLAVHEAVSSLIGPGHAAQLTLKWPNDVLLDGHKLAGILLESASAGSGDVGWLAIGMGINLAVFPDNPAYPATALRVLGLNITLAEMLEALARAFETWIAIWRREQDFGLIREAWLARAQGLGGPITVRLADETFEGTFMGLAGDGALQVKMADGALRAVSAGDVFFPGHGA